MFGPLAQHRHRLLPWLTFRRRVLPWSTPRRRVLPWSTLRRRALPWLLAPAILLAPAAPAAARPSAFSSVEQVYATTGTVPPCRFSSTELTSALKQAPTYDVEYFGDFINAVNGALNARAAGACGSRQTAAGLRESGLNGVRSLPPPGSATSGTYASIPLPLLVMLIMLILALITSAALALMRVGGWDPVWAQLVRHSWNEAEYRIGGTWAAWRGRRRG